MSNQIPPLHTTALSLTQTLTSFLTVAFHTILYHRALYPSTTFLRTRAYNFPVYQSRHPAVCTWINNTIAALTPLLLKSSVRQIVFVIHNDQGEVMERYLFNIERFPTVGEKEVYMEFATRPGDEGREGNPELMKGASKVDVDEQLRATVRRLQYGCDTLRPLPEDCTYTVAVELRDEKEPPIGNPQPWIPSEPGLQTGEKGGSETIGKDLGGVKTVPVRLVEAGEFIVEAFIEIGRRQDDEDSGDPP